MKNCMILVVVAGLIVVELASHVGGSSICSWSTLDRSELCEQHEFQCSNGVCVSRAAYCDDVDDCGDNSDEEYCGSRDCNACQPYSHRCIPNKWICDGHHDCPYGVNENNCRSRSTARINSAPAADPAQSEIAMDKVKLWISRQRNGVRQSDDKWGINVDTLALTSYLLDNTFNFLQPGTKDDMVYESTIQLLSRLSSMKFEDIPSTDLASYLNAFLVMCVNPRKFHGHNIVQELRNRVDKEKYTNPYVVLALCNAGETITESDKNNLLDTFSNKHRTFWTGMQAVVVMALACASKQPGNEVDAETLREMALELKQQQYRNGTIVDLPTTALVMQALISINSESDPDNFDEAKAFQELLRNQKPDGSFGNVMNTFLVTPVLTCKSLADISSSHCQYGSGDEMSALEHLSRRKGPKIRVQYSIWIGNERDLERNLILRVPQNTSLYSVMEIAAEVDSRFKLEYSIKNRKPYVNAISGMTDNPLTGKFWFLYVIQDGKPTLSNETPVDIIPNDNDHFVMWYRRGTWVE